MQAPKTKPTENPTLRAVSDQPVINRIVDRRLIHSLFDSATPTLTVGLLVACVVFLAVWRNTGRDTIAFWLVAVASVTVVRLLMIPWLRRNLDSAHVRRIGLFYAGTAFIAGLTWAAAILFDDPGHPIGVRLMILIMVVGMPIASLSSNAVYRPAYFAFAGPIFASLFYWAWWKIPDMALEFTLFAFLYTVLTSIMAMRFHHNLRRSLMRDIENELLLHEVNTMNSELQRMAYKDSLTGLSNRRSFEETTAELLARLRKGDTLALMLIDMDNFKLINDTLGHAAGDAALIELSRRIEDNSRLREMVAHTQMGTARIGGDEFIALYRLDPGSSIEPVAARILDALTEPMVFERQRYQPGVSIGIALAPQNGEDVDELLRAADHAMYAAKGAGGGQFVIASPRAATA